MINAILSIAFPLRLLALFVAGACLGAGVNLAIYRLAYLRRRISPWSRPRGLVSPRGWFARIPILGWPALRHELPIHGRGFWIRPMLLELCFAAGLPTLYWWEVGKLALISPPLPAGFPPLGPDLMAILHAQFAVHVVLIALMAIATFIDIDEQTIPDSITVPGTVIALLLAIVCTQSMLPGYLDAPPLRIMPLTLDFPEHAAVFLQGVGSLVVGLACYLAWCFALLPRRWRRGVGAGKAWRVLWRRIAARDEWKWVLPVAIGGVGVIIIVWSFHGPAWRGLMSALIGMAAGAGMIWAIRLIGGAALEREAMGFGDVTLMAMIGAFLGWQPILFVFFLAPMAGVVIGVIQWIVIRDNVIPYGPFLCLGALTVIVFWAPIWERTNHVFDVPWLAPSAIAICLPLLALMLYGWRLVRERIAGH